jgi:hypothetical protein
VQTTETVIAVTKAAPPVTVTGATIFGIPLPEVVLWATLVYTAMQGYVLIRDKFYKPWKEKRDGLKARK